jgi:transcriptional regulator with XRE-family HTH domain
MVHIWIEMASKVEIPYSRYSREAVALLGKLIRAARTERRMTATEVAERAGISRGRMQRIEKGELTSEIGAVFEVAAIVGLQLFDADTAGLARLARQADDKLALLPRSVRSKPVAVKDDF